RPDDVAAPADDSPMAGVGRCANRTRTGPRVALYPRVISERSASRSHGARTMVARAGRRRSGYVPAGDDAPRCGWLRAIRDFKRRQTGTRVSSQPEILDRRGVAW